jgi:hypothetical protein
MAGFASSAAMLIFVSAARRIFRLLESAERLM